jgi:hypothetical protein
MTRITYRKEKKNSHYSIFLLYNAIDRKSLFWSTEVSIEKLLGLLQNFVFWSFIIGGDLSGDHSTADANFFSRTRSFLKISQRKRFDTFILQNVIILYEYIRIYVSSRSFRVEILKIITYTNIFTKQLVNENFACCVIA